MPEQRTIRPRVLYFGTPVALISTLMPDGSPNLSPMSSVWALDDRLVLGLGTSGQGLENLQRTAECVVNLPSAELWHQVERLGPTTGRFPVPEAKRSIGYVHEPRKFERAQLTALPSETVLPPRVAECPLQLEAALLAVHPPAPLAGGALPDFRIVEVRVMRVHAHADVTFPGTEHVDPRRWHPLLYVFRTYVAAGAALGDNFRKEPPRLEVVANVGSGTA